MEITLWCDESISKGRFCSNFYGGAAVCSAHLVKVSEGLKNKKAALNFIGEVKWSKVTENYLQKYIDLTDLFFDYIEAREVRVRIMFTQNIHVPVLKPEHVEHQFHLLYYQFVKHAFGFSKVTFAEQTRLRIYFDSLPETREKNERFKEFVLGLINGNGTKGLVLHREDIAEVDSKKHDILQCLDVVLGAMAFRLNNMHLEKLPGTRRRGKRTIAKERLYKHINARIRKIYPGFNIGVSTGKNEGDDSHWEMPYRHWLFVPNNVTIDRTKKK